MEYQTQTQGFDFVTETTYVTRASLVAQSLKRMPAMRETWVQSLGQEDPLKNEMATHPVFLPENPMDGGAWWAIIHGVAKGQTQLSDLTFTFH